MHKIKLPSEIVSFFVVFILAQNLSEAASCRNLLTSSDLVVNGFKIVGQESGNPDVPRMKQRFLVEVKSLVSSLLSMLDGHLEAPNGMTIKVMSSTNPDPFSVFSGEAISYDAFELMVRIPARIFLYKGRAGKAKEAKRTQVHELAHSIFDWNARKKSASWERTRQMQVKILELWKRSRSGNSAIYSFIQKRLTPEELVEYNSLWKPIYLSVILEHIEKLQIGRAEGNLTRSQESDLLNSLENLLKSFKKHQETLRNYVQRTLSDADFEVWVQMNKVTGKIETKIERLQIQVLQFRQIEMMYDEFFAEALTVAFLADPLPILKSAYSKNNREYDRNFSTPIPEEAVSDEKTGPPRLLLRLANDFGSTAIVKVANTKWATDARFGGHEILDPTQSYVWNKYATTSLYRNNVGLYVKKLFQATIKEIEARHADPKLLNLSPRELNRRLIERIDQEFQQ